MRTWNGIIGAISSPLQIVHTIFSQIDLCLNKTPSVQDYKSFVLLVVWSLRHLKTKRANRKKGNGRGMRVLLIVVQGIIDGDHPGENITGRAFGYCDQLFHLKFIGSNQGDSESVSGVITEYVLRRIKGTAIPICDRQAAADIL